MISRDIAVVDWHPEHWIRMMRRPAGAGSKASGGWLVLVRDEQERIVHAVLRGARCPELVGQPVGELAVRRREHDVDRVVCIEQGFLRRTFSHAESRLQFEMDYVEQLLTLIAAFRAERGSGLRLDPPSPPGPVPPFAWLQFLFNRAWPDDTSVLIYVIDEERAEIWTSLVLRKRGGHLDLLTSDLHFGEHGLRAGSWREDRARLLALASGRVAPPFLGLFASREGWRQWRRAALGSGALPALRKQQRVVLDPLPRRVQGLLMAIRALGRLLRR